MRQTIKKYMSALLLGSLVVACALFTSGCHGSKGMDEFVIPQEFDTGRTYEITFWAKNDTNKTQTAIYEKAISDFEKLYPNIKVNMRLYTDYARIYNDVITNIATKTTPNVCITYPDHIATYLTGSNLVVPLEDLLVNEAYGLGGDRLEFDSPKKDEIIPEFLEECAFAGHYYALPYMRSTEACYINKTFVEALGYELPDILSWDFIWEVSEAAMEQDVNGNYVLNGQKTMIPFIYKSTDNMMIQMLAQKEAGYSTEAGEIALFNETTNELLYTIAEHGKTGAFSTFKISSYPANFLNAGQCVFAIDSTAGATWMGSNAPLSDISEDKIVNFETVVMPIPQFDKRNPKMISQGPSVCLFNKDDPQEVLASWFFMQYLLTNEVQIAYSQTEGYVPVTAKAQNDAVYKDYLSRCGEDNELYYDVKINATRLLLENTDNTFVTPVFNGSASLRQAAGELIESTVKAVRRNQSVDDAFMQKTQKETTSLYRLDQIRTGDYAAADEKTDLGPLPGTAVYLIVVLCVTWGLIIISVGFLTIKQKRNQQ